MTDPTPAELVRRYSAITTAVTELFERRLPANTGDIRGMGLLLGIDLVTDRATRAPVIRLVKRVVLRAFRAGLLLGTSWDWQTLILMPPLNLDDAAMDRALAILDETLGTVRGS